MSDIIPLHKIIPLSERKRCAYCDKPLRPRTWYVDQESCPKVGEIVGVNEIVHIYRKSRAFSTNRNRWHFWDGTWDAYDQLFCTYNCGVKFGTAAHKAGYRIKGNHET